MGRGSPAVERVTGIVAARAPDGQDGDRPMHARSSLASDAKNLAELGPARCRRARVATAAGFSILPAGGFSGNCGRGA